MRSVGKKTQAPETLTIREAVENVLKGKYVLAPFQRPNVWQLKQQKELLQSLLEGIPIGNILLKEYKLGTEKREIPGIPFPKKSNGEIDEECIDYIIIDGQQRLSFLSWLKKKLDNENFKYGPSNLFYYDLKNDLILNNKREKNDDEYLKEGVIIINKYFDEEYQNEVSNSISKWKVSKDKKYDALMINNNLASVFTNEKRIVTIKATSETDEKFGFRLYEVVNKSGIKLKGIDYIEGALYQICPELFEKVNKAISNLIELPSTEKKTSKVVKIKSYNKLFTRTIFTRSLIDYLFHTPNPEERNNVKSKLFKLKEFEDVKTENNKILDKDEILNGFEEVRKSFKIIKEILNKHLKFKDDQGINNLILIPANALFRKTVNPSIKDIGHFIKWFILFHINGKPYLGKADFKLKNDCNAARNGNVKKLIENLISNLKYSNEDELLFNKKTYINSINKEIQWDHNSENKEKFLRKIQKFLSILNNAKDWLHPLEIANIDIGHLDEHHIFPKNMFGKNSDLEKWQKRRRDNPINIAHLHYLSNGSKILKESPDIYLKTILKSNKEELENQQIPLKEKLWDFNNYDNFIESRIEMLVKDFNDIIKKLNSDDWNKKISTENSDAYFFDNIKDSKFDESKIIEYKETFCDFNSKLEKDYASIAFKEICAFLNTSGGTLYLGISDCRNKIGLDNEFKLLEEKLKKENKPCDLIAIRDQFNEDFKNKFIQYFDKDIYLNNIKTSFIQNKEEKWVFKVNISKVNWVDKHKKVEMKKCFYWDKNEKGFKKRDNKKQVMWAQRIGPSSHWGSK